MASASARRRLCSLKRALPDDDDDDDDDDDACSLIPKYVKAPDT